MADILTCLLDLQNLKESKLYELFNQSYTAKIDPYFAFISRMDVTILLGLFAVKSHFIVTFQQIEMFLSCSNL